MYYGVEGTKDELNKQQDGFDSHEEAEEYAINNGWDNIRIIV